MYGGTTWVVAEMKKLIILLLILCLLVPGVLALPPKIIMTVSGTGGTVPYTVEVSEDSKDETIVRWEWAFGDGTQYQGLAVLFIGISVAGVLWGLWQK